jgi:secondary thiamine-phosphate synthase enzyme
MAERIDLRTGEREVLVDVTSRVAEAVAATGVAEGWVQVYCPHTTAGVTINEHADPSVRDDIVMTLGRLVPRDLAFTHLEGNSDAHMKASMLGSSTMVPIVAGRLELGTWQGIYFAEFDGPRRRRVQVQALARAAEGRD